MFLSVSRPKVKVSLLSSGINKLGKYTLWGQESIYFGYLCVANTQHNAGSLIHLLFVRRTNEKFKEQYSCAYNVFISMQEDTVSNTEFLE